MEFGIHTMLDILGGISPEASATRRRNESIARMVEGIADTIIQSVDGNFPTDFTRGPWVVKTDPKARLATLTLKGMPDFPGYAFVMVDNILKSEELFILLKDGNEELPVWCVEVRG